MSTHLRGCLGATAYGCGGTFRCSTCKRTVGWCRGSSDCMPGACDDCWVKAHRKGGRHYGNETCGDPAA